MWDVPLPLGHFRYIKIQLDGKSWRTKTKAMNKHGHSISFALMINWVFVKNASNVKELFDFKVHN